MKPVAFSGVKDVYLLDGLEGCKPENAPCETGSSYAYDSNGFVNKSIQGDVPGATWKLVTEYAQEGTTGNAWTQTHKSIPATDERSIERTYQDGRVLTSKWSGVAWKRFDVTRDPATGLVTASRDSEALTTSYSYDALGRLVSMSPPGEQPFAYCYKTSRTSDSFVLAKRGTCSVESPAEGPSDSGSGSASYEAYHYDALGRLERRIRRMPAAQTGGGSVFSFQQTSYAANGEVSFSSEWAPCVPHTWVVNGQNFSDANDPRGCFGLTAAYGRRFQSFDVFDRPLVEFTPAVGGAEARKTLRRYDVCGNGNELMMGEWRQTGPASDPKFIRHVELRSALGNPMAVMEGPGFTSEGDTASSPGYISFLYWNTMGKLARAQDDGKDLQYPCGAPAAPPTPEPASKQARTWKWDPSGFLLRETHPELSMAVTNDGFDGLGNVTSRSEAGMLHAFVYDPAGRLTSHVAGSGTSLSNGYDPNTGRLTFRRMAAPDTPIPFPATSQTTFTLFTDEDFLYSNGKLQRRGLLLRDGTNGTREAGPGRFDVTWQYGPHGEVTAETRTAPGVPLYTVSFTWKSGALNAATDATGAGVNGSSYRPSALLTGMSQSNGVTVEHVLDTYGRPRPVTISASRGGSAFYSRDYSYDGDGNVTAVGTDVYGYDALSRLTSSPWEAYEYDRFGNMTKRGGTPIGVNANTNRLNGGTTVYDSRGNLTRKDTIGFSYDGFGRNSGYETWTYDSRTRRWTAKRAITNGYDGANERVVKLNEQDGTPVTRRAMARWLLQAKEQTPATGCVAGQERFEDVPCSDPDWGWIEKMATLGITTGYPPEPPSTRNTYKPERQVQRQEMAAFLTRAGYGGVAITNPGNPVPDWSDVPPDSIFRGYINRIFADKITSGCSPVGNSFCPLNLVTEQEMRAFVGRGGLIWQATLNRTYWPGVGILPPSAEIALRDGQNRVVMEYRESNRAGARNNLYFGNVLAMSKVAGVAEYYVSDHLGSPRVVTDASGNTKETRTYKPYGEQVVGTTAQKLGFAQMELDYESGSHNDHARFYRSAFARFLSPDELQGAPTDPQSWNRYTYARNNPIRYVDPDGKAFILAPAAAPAAAELTAYVGGAVITYFIVQQAMERFAPGFHGRFSSEFGRAPNLHLSEEAKDSAQGSTGEPGTYRPARGLPTKENGEPKAEEGAAGPHTQLGTKEGSKGDYTKGREFDANGKPVKDIDFTDHGRKDHPNPHEHVWEPNPTGGTPQRRPARPLQGEEQLP